MPATIPFILPIFLSLFYGIPSAATEGLQLPLRSVDAPTGNGPVGSLKTDSVKTPLALSGTGLLGWETLQMTVALGTPPQPLNVTLDYTSSTVIVFADGYNETHCKGISTRRHTFSKEKSSTFSLGNADMAMELNKPFADVKDCGGLNNTGWSSGSLVIDHVTVGTKTATNVSFYLMDQAQHFNPQWASDGIFGLAIDFDCWFDEDNCTIVGFLKTFGDPVVGVYLPSNQGVGTGPSGAISFGSVDLAECSSNWQWVQKGVPKIPEWNILVKSFDLGSYHGSLTNRPAMLFSYAAHIWAPPKIFNKIISTLRAEYSFKDDEYIVQCAKVGKGQLPDMTFSLDGMKQVVPAKMYTRPLPQDPKSCVLLVRDSSEYFSPGMDAWLFGTSFLRASCHAVDFKNNRIGFAPFA